MHHHQSPERHLQCCQEEQSQLLCLLYWYSGCYRQSTSDQVSRLDLVLATWPRVTITTPAESHHTSILHGADGTSTPPNEGLTTPPHKLIDDMSLGVVDLAFGISYYGIPERE
jgi:hypothetical protein